MSTARSRRRERRAQARRDAEATMPWNLPDGPLLEALTTEVETRMCPFVQTPVPVHRNPVSPEAEAALRSWAASNRAER